MGWGKRARTQPTRASGLYPSPSSSPGEGGGKRTADPGGAPLQSPGVSPPDAPERRRGRARGCSGAPSQRWGPMHEGAPHGASYGPYGEMPYSPVKMRHYLVSPPSVSGCDVGHSDRPNGVTVTRRRSSSAGGNALSRQGDACDPASLTAGRTGVCEEGGVIFGMTVTHRVPPSFPRTR